MDVLILRWVLTKGFWLSSSLKNIGDMWLSSTISNSYWICYTVRYMYCDLCFVIWSSTFGKDVSNMSDNLVSLSILSFTNTILSHTWSLSSWVKSNPPVHVTSTYLILEIKLWIPCSYGITIIFIFNCTLKWDPKLCYHRIF